MECQRYRCAPIAALLLAGASLVFVPEQASAQGFSAGLTMSRCDDSEWLDRRVEEKRHHFDRRRFEEARFEMARAFEDRHDAWHEMKSDRREQNGSFTSGLKLQGREGEKGASAHGRVAEGARYLYRPADEMKQKKMDHAHDGAPAPVKMTPVMAKNGQGESAKQQPGAKKMASDPVRTSAGAGNLVGNRAANGAAGNAAAPGVAKSGPGTPVKQPNGGGQVFDPARANVNNAAPGKLVGSRSANLPPVAAAAPAAVKNDQTGPRHHLVKNGAGNQGQQACAKQGQGNQAANKDAANGALANNGIGKRQGANKNGGAGNLVGNQNAQGIAAAKNPNPQANGNLNHGGPGSLVGKHRGNPNAQGQAANPKNGAGNQGMQACAKQGPGNSAANKNANQNLFANNGFTNPTAANKNGNTGNLAHNHQAFGNLNASAKNGAGNPMPHQAGSNKNGAGHSAYASSVKTAPTQHAPHVAVAKQGHGHK